MPETVLFVERWQPNYAISSCRICHEEEFESCKTLESPCACSGTLKFAHRDCIQRWCDEKGDTTCEICLQKYEPGYITTPKKPQPLADEMVGIRGSLDITRRNQELQNPTLVAVAEDEFLESEYTECTSTADRSASCCRTVALAFMLLLLARHVIYAIASGSEVQYPFSLLMVLAFRMCGIIVPMYIILRSITAVQDSIRRNHNHLPDSFDQSLQFNRANEDEQQQHHSIDIQS